MTHRDTFRRSVGVVTVVLSAATLSGACSSSADHATGDHSRSTSISVPANASYNAADLAFVQGMLPHHQQAVTMADSAIATSSYLDVVEFATTIRATQSSEIEQLRGWLVAWGQPEADPSMDPSMDMAGMPGMSGASFAADMEHLSSTKSLDYAELWLDLMVEHHRSALTMARTEVESGKDPDVIALAQAILSTQQTEIDAMTALKPLLG